MKSLYFVSFCLLASSLIAQENQISGKEKKTYWASVSEFIFSFADLGNVRVYETNSASGQQPEGSLVNPIPRFSAFLHLAQQYHIKFTRYAGVYTGLGFRNIGMINNLNDTLRIKQRAYGASIPLALKLGNIDNRSYLALGAEIEYLFHYKQKVFVGDGRGKKDNKTSEWFSNRVNAINPGVFLEYNFGKSGYFRLKYYLNDFLSSTVTQDFKVKGDDFYFTSERSTLFSLTFGKVIVNNKKKSKETPTKKATT